MYAKETSQGQLKHFELSFDHSSGKNKSYQFWSIQRARLEHCTCLFAEVPTVENRRQKIGELKIKYSLNIGQTYLEKKKKEKEKETYSFLSWSS